MKMMTCSISESLEQAEEPEGGEGIWTELPPQPWIASAMSSAAALVPSLSSSRRFIDEFVKRQEFDASHGR